MKRAKLRSLRRQLKLAIQESRHAHGVWVEYHKGHDMRRRHGSWVAWQKSIKHIQNLQAQIMALEIALQKTATTASLALAQAVAIWEGGRSSDGMFRPYQDEVGVWTIGYGHTNADGAPTVGPSTKPLFPHEAVVLLLHDLAVQYATATKAAFDRFNWKKVLQKQFDAATSFAYNLGPGDFRVGTSIGNAMATHDVPGVGSAMLLYDHAGNQRLPGLTRRRQWEKQLWDGGTYTVNN